ncbi:MAG: DUF432 domain-containing protein [Methanomicrobia archaeon]|nr:DUF432 domain-containing protein [Methanomicrobia archaeon]
MFDIKKFGIEIKQDKGKYIYKRNEIEKIVFGEKIIFDLFPIISSGISNYLELKLKNPLVIASSSKIKLKITAPYDIEARALKRKEWISIETIRIQKEKYTLYGPVESGVLCRYFESEFGEKKDTAILNLKIENQTKEWQEIKKIVFPANFHLSYDKKVYYPPLELTLNALGLTISKSEAVKGLKIERFIKDLGVQKKYTMVWGY